MTGLHRERWQRVAALLDDALELEPGDRSRFLDEACGADEALRAEVEALLAADDHPSPLLDSPFDARAVLDASEVRKLEGAQVGRRVGAYRIVRELGRGGMGAVYLAERADGQYEQQVALKLVRGGFESGDLVRRFVHERQILARLEHPHIARILDGGLTEEGLPFFVMEYVEGDPITVHCDRRRLNIPARLRLFADVCEAVAHAHRNLIVHRDLKPSNILVRPDGQVKLLDFGIAKLLDENASSVEAGRTRTGAYLLTPEYASPEQVRGDPITTATDVYALGAVLYELLSGRRAHSFAAYSPAELTRVVTEVPTPPPSAVVMRSRTGSEDGTPAQVASARGTEPARLRRALLGDLDAIVMKALRKEPRERYVSVDALSADLHRQRSALPVAARRGTAAYRARKYLRRHRGAVLAVSLLVFSLAGGFIAATRQASVAQRESARAREVTAFLVGLFRASHPAEARGRTLSALELLDSGVVRVDRQLEGQPELQEEMLTVLGSIYRELGSLPRSDTLLRRAVFLGERLYGRESEHLIGSLNELGGLLLAAGDYAAADSVLQRALSIRERVLGPRDTLVAVGLNNLALVRTRRGDHQEAERLYRRALEIDVAALGREHLKVATDLSNLGGVLREKGEYDAADSAMSAAIGIRRRLLPQDDPSIADALAQLAVLRNAQGRGADAEQLHREALALRQKVYGDDHPDVALSLSSLASTLSSLGRLEESAPLLHQAFEIQQRVLGPDHDNAIGTLNNLAVLHYRLGDLDAAVLRMREALRRWQRVLGEGHPRVSTAANNLGVVLTEKGDYRDAEQLLRSSLEARRARYGEEHPDVASSLRNLGVLLHRTRREPQAEQAFRRALEIGRAVWPGEHPRLAEVLVSYGELLIDQARHGEAEAVLSEALGIRRALFGEDAAAVADVERLLARALSAQDGHTEAAAFLRQP